MFSLLIKKGNRMQNLNDPFDEQDFFEDFEEFETEDINETLKSYEDAIDFKDEELIDKFQLYEYEEKDERKRK